MAGQARALYPRSLLTDEGTMSMLVSALSNHLKKAELERHTSFMKQCLQGEDAREITMVLRSPASGPAHAFLDATRELCGAGIGARIVLGRLEPEAELKRLFLALSTLSPKAAAKDLIRWARNPRLLDAHEQATYGESMCWSGDAMRREPDKRDALSLFFEDAPEATRLARCAFAALWNASCAIAEQRLVGRETKKPSGAYGSDASRLASMSVLRAAPYGWPLIRH